MIFATIGCQERAPKRTSNNNKIVCLGMNLPEIKHLIRVSMYVPLLDMFGHYLLYVPVIILELEFHELCSLDR